jgi:hypothetical protein
LLFVYNATAFRSLAYFDGVLYGVVNPDVLLSTMTTQEAVLSSKIERTLATLGEVLRFEAGDTPLEESRVLDIEEIMHYRREGAKIIQRVVTPIGRMDQIQEKGEIENLVRSLSRFSEKVLLVLSGKSDVRADARKIGPALICERLWKKLEIGKIIQPEGLSAKDPSPLKVKELRQVEQVFRDMKSVLDTRPIFHNLDETIRGHVFCSFLALVIRKELDRRLEKAGHCLKWADIKQDLKALQEITIEDRGKTLAIRSECLGTCGKIFQAVGVAIPPTIREVA